MTDLERGPSSDGESAICAPSLNTPSPHSRVVERLRDDARQLRKMAEACVFAGHETGVRVKDPTALGADLDEAATIISGLEATVQRLTANPADHRYWEGRYRDEKAEVDRLQSELDTANNNHRSMAHQLAETGERALAAESSLHRVRAETVWQPIETAPKDGSDVLLYFPLEGLSAGFEKVIIAHWRKSAGDLINCYWVWQGRAYRGYSEAYQPTHWMPLPAPPAVADTSADAPWNVGLVSGVSADQTSLTNKTGENDAEKTAQGGDSPSTQNAETE